MLAAQIDAILTDFTRRRIPFSHRDVAACLPDLDADQLEEVRRLVFEKMLEIPAYRLSVAHFVGEGPTVMCFPRATAPDLPLPIETPAVESGRLAA